MNKNILVVLIVFSINFLVQGQSVLNSLNYVTVDNLNDNNTATNGTILCDTSYCEVGPGNPVAGDNNGWWSQIDVQSISYNGTVRVTPKIGGVQRPAGSKATYFFNVPASGNYLVYTYLFASGNASSNAYITFKRFGEWLNIDSLKYDQAIHQVLAPGTVGCWVPWRICNLNMGARTFEVTIGGDSLTQPYMRADAVRILRSSDNGPDLEFGRRAFSGFDSVRVIELFPAITYKLKEYFDKTIKLFNIGKTDLIINSAGFSTSRFSVITNFPFVIAPGASANLIARFTPKGEETTNDSLKIQSNDINEPIAYLPVRGEGINYNFIMNASENGNEPHWNAPQPASYTEIGQWQNSTGRSPFTYPIPGGNLRSRYFPVDNNIPVAIYNFKIPDTLAGNYMLEYGGPYSSNSTQTAVVEVVTPFTADTMKVFNFNQNIPQGGEVWKRISDNNRRIFPLMGGDQTNVKITRTAPGSGVLRADLLRVRMLPIAPNASTSLDNDNRILTFSNVSIYDSIRLAEFNYQKTVQIRSNGEQPLVLDSIKLSGKYSRFFKIENNPTTPVVLPAIDGIYNLVVSFLPKDTIYIDSTFKITRDSITQRDSTVLIIDTTIGGIRNYPATLSMKTNDTIKNKQISISISGNSVGNTVTSDDSDPGNYANTAVIDWNPILPYELNKWQRVYGSGNNNSRIFTYIYGYQYMGIPPDSNHFEWYPSFPKRPGGPITEIDSFNVYALLPAGSYNGNPRAVYEIYSPITGLTRLVKNQNSTIYGGNVPSSGKLFLGKYSFLRGGSDIHGSGTIFGHIRLINSFSDVTEFYKDSLINKALVDSHVTRADAVVFEQLSRISNTENTTEYQMEYFLSNNYPNPFNSGTKISFVLPKDDMVELIIYDFLGRKLRTLVNEVRLKGSHHLEWDGKDERGYTISSGIYFYRIITAGFIKTKKMILIK